jgi:TetR/AcrR family acrAB operon transcriptional repressor
MVRKTKEDTEATRAAILDAAELCFLSKGVARTTLEDIAMRAGHTRGAVYWHFSNKLEVFEAVLDRVESPLFAELEQLSSSSNPAPLETLRQFYVIAFRELSRNPHARNAVEILFLHCELAEETRPILNREQRSASRSLARITEALARAKRLKQLRPELDPAHCGMILHCCVTGLLREWLLNPQKISLEAAGVEMVEILLRGFAVDAIATAGKQTTRRLRTLSK